MSEYFPEPKIYGRKVKVELDLPDYATKPDLKSKVLRSKILKIKYLSLT